MGGGRGDGARSTDTRAIRSTRIKMEWRRERGKEGVGEAGKGGGGGGQGG